MTFKPMSYREKQERWPDSSDPEVNRRNRQKRFEQMDKEFRFLQWQGRLPPGVTIEEAEEIERRSREDPDFPEGSVAADALTDAVARQTGDASFREGVSIWKALGVSVPKNAPEWAVSLKFFRWFGQVPPKGAGVTVVLAKADVKQWASAPHLLWAGYAWAQDALNMIDEECAKAGVVHLIVPKALLHDIDVLRTLVEDARKKVAR